MNEEQFLLTLMAEEAVEIAQRATKAIRFGLDEVQSGQDLTNRQRLMLEIFDFLTILELTEADLGLLTDEDKSNFGKHAYEKSIKINKYYEYSKELGCVS